MLILGSLVIMLVILFFSLIFDYSFIGSSTTNTVNNDLLINGSTSSLSTQDYTFAVNIDPTIGLLTIIIAVITLASIIGIQILGSGLSDTSIHVITVLTAYYGLWIALTVMVSGFIFQIELFGALIYMSLTIMYSIGIIQKITGGSEV